MCIFAGVKIGQSWVHLTSNTCYGTTYSHFIEECDHEVLTSKSNVFLLTLKDFVVLLFNFISALQKFVLYFLISCGSQMLKDLT